MSDVGDTAETRETSPLLAGPNPKTMRPRYTNEREDGSSLIPDDSVVIIHSVSASARQSEAAEDTEELLRDVDEGSVGESGTLGASSISRIVLDNNESACQVIQKSLKKFFGIFCALIAGLFGAGLTISVKILTNHGFHPFLLTLIKYQVSTIFGPPIVACIYCCSSRKTIFDHIWPLNGEAFKNLCFIFIRTTCGVLQTILQYYSLRYLNVADSCVILMSNSITTVFLARLFLNEPLGLVPVLVGILTCCGVVVMTKPPFITGEDTFDDNMLLGVTLAMTSMIMASLIIILVRYMRKLHFCVFVTMYGYMATIEILVLIVIQNGMGSVLEIPYEPKYWAIMASCALFAFCGQSLNVLSLQYERASHISLVRTCDIIFTFLLQFIFLGIHPDINSVLGAFILLTGTFIIGLRRCVMSLPSHHPYRRRYRFLMK